MHPPLPRGLAGVTLGKVVANTALRAPYVFLTPVAERLHTTVGHLGFLLGMAELGGLSTALIGRSLDRGRYPQWIVTGAAAGAAGSAVMATLHTALGFAGGFALAAAGVAWYTTAGHAWLGREVPYERRGRSIGLFETSWAVALLVGVPIVGFLLTLGRWWTPFATLSALSLLSAGLLWRALPRRAETEPPAVPARLRPNPRVVLTLTGSFAITFASISVFAVYGSWLHDRFGLSTRVVGVLSVSIGLAELVASGATARFTDRWGKAVSVRRGSMVMAVGVVAVVASPRVAAFGVAALVIVFLGFEFAFVSLLSIVSEVGVDQRGAVLGVDHSLTTVSRALSAALATTLYDAHGIGLAAAISLSAVALSALAFRLAKVG